MTNPAILARVGFTIIDIVLTMSTVKSVRALAPVWFRAGLNNAIPTIQAVDPEARMRCGEGDWRDNRAGRMMVDAQ
jgi:hypothetical protein